MMPTQADAIRLCELIEPLCQEFGYHVALTGGCLYGSRSTQPLAQAHAEERKDIDIVFYRIRQVDIPNREGLWYKLRDELGIEHKNRFGWMDKAELGHLKIDAFFPEDGNGAYEQTTDEALNGY